MAEKYSVRITKDYLVFSAAHFITFAGDTCERLHGHNYKVAVDVAGPLDENHYVVDFIALRDALQQMVMELDHRVLLPTKHPTITVNACQDRVTASWRDRTWVFPADDCILLPIANTTTELLARHIGLQFQRRLDSLVSTAIEEISVAVDENEGQWGVWRWTANR